MGAVTLQSSILAVEPQLSKQWVTVLDLQPIINDIKNINTAGVGEAGLGANTFTGVQTYGTANIYKGATTITAFATGGAGSATPLTAEYNQVTVVATAGDSVILSTPALGSVQHVTNLGAFACDVFPVTGGTIDGGSANTAVRLQPGQTVSFKGLSATAVQSNNSASGAVTQITSITTGVTLNASKGIVTTVAATAGAAGATPNTFTVTNSFVQADSHISVYVIDYAGTIATNGNPFVIADNRADGTFDIIISNAHGTNALNGVMKIGFEVKN